MPKKHPDFSDENTLAIQHPDAFQWIISEMVDAARKYGQAFHTTDQRRLELTLPGNRRAWLHVKMNGNDFIIVSHEPGGLNVTQDGMLFSNAQQTILIAWSKYVGVMEVMQAVHELDMQMADAERYDPDTGIRYYAEEEPEVQEDKPSVEAVFNPPWAHVGITLAAEMTDEEIKNIFDRPEEIVIVAKDGVIVRLATVRGQAMRAEAEAATLKEYGYAREFLHVVSKAVMDEINAAVLVRLQAMLI